MSERIFVDSHMHTPLCKHAYGEPEEYAARALVNGLQAIVITCHSPMPRGFWPHVRMSEWEFDHYTAMIERCRKRHEGELEVRLGLESDYFPGMEPWIESLHQRADFHYILGSVHWQGPEYRQRYEFDGADAFRRSYFENLAASAETGYFDCLSHPDLIKNYLPNLWDFEVWEDTIAASLDRVAKTGVAMELNTSGLYKSYSEMNPGPQMLKLMAERGIPVVLGSDSHRPMRVAENFIAGLNHLTDAGYTKVSVFKNRKRQDLEIETVLASIKKHMRQPELPTLV